MIYLRKFNTAMDAKGQVIDLPCVASWGGGGDSSNVEYFSLYQKDKTKLNVTDDGTGIKANRGFIKFSANSSDGTIYINPNVPANKDCLILNDSGLYIDRKSSIDKDVAGVHYYGYDYSGLGGGFDIYVTIDDIVTYYLTDFYQFTARFALSLFIISFWIRSWKSSAFWTFTVYLQFFIQFVQNKTF